MLKITITCSLLFIGYSAICQSAFISETFYENRIVNGQSVEMSNPGSMKFLISHRFGHVNGGAYELWGLDQSTIRLGFDYGIKDWLTIGIGRSSFLKTFDGFYKLRILNQGGEKKNPVTVVFFNSASIRSQKWPTQSPINYEFTHRVSFTSQFLIARKITDKVSLQLMPTWVHRNFVETDAEKNDVIAIGAAGRFKISKNVTTSFEYHLLPDGMSTNSFYNNLAFAIDINTKGHVFQLTVGNATGLTEKYFITENRGDWLNGDVGIGFNISRDFKIKGKKY